MKNINGYLYMLGLVSGLIFNSCKQDDYTPQTDLLYEVTVEGSTAAFSIKTAGVSDYRWDFGDGQTSNEANPTHTYPGKGKYVPTLVANVNGKKAEASTVLRIAKTTPVKMNDNSFDDWASVTKDVLPLGTGKGVFNAVKLDYDGNYVYMYVEMVGKKSDGTIFDVYLDSDNNITTGLLTGTFTGGAYDILLEGQLLLTGLDIFYHNSTDQSSFSFAPQSIADAYTLGTVKEENNVLKFEWRFARGKLKGLTGSGLRIAIQAVKSDWSAFIGSVPNENSESYFLDMSE